MIKFLACLLFHRYERTFAGSYDRLSFWNMRCAKCDDDWTEVEYL